MIRQECLRSMQYFEAGNGGLEQTMPGESLFLAEWADSWRLLPRLGVEKFGAGTYAHPERFTAACFSLFTIVRLLVVACSLVSLWLLE